MPRAPNLLKGSGGRTSHRISGASRLQLCGSLPAPCRAGLCGDSRKRPDCEAGCVRVACEASWIRKAPRCFSRGRFSRLRPLVAPWDLRAGSPCPHGAGGRRERRAPGRLGRQSVQAGGGLILIFSDSHVLGLSAFPCNGPPFIGQMSAMRSLVCCIHTFSSNAIHQCVFAARTSSSEHVLNHAKVFALDAMTSLEKADVFERNQSTNARHR